MFAHCVIKHLVRCIGVLLTCRSLVQRPRRGAAGDRTVHCRAAGKPAQGGRATSKPTAHGGVGRRQPGDQNHHGLENAIVQILAPLSRAHSLWDKEFRLKYGGRSAARSCRWRRATCRWCALQTMRPWRWQCSRPAHTRWYGIGCATPAVRRLTPPSRAVRTHTPLRVR
jgi:hypothetical protein